MGKLFAGSMTRVIPTASSTGTQTSTKRTKMNGGRWDHQQINRTMTSVFHVPVFYGGKESKL